MNLFYQTYPLSFFILLFGFIIGIGISIVFFFSFSFTLVLFLLCIGCLRIMPMLNFLDIILTKMFPKQIKLFSKNIKTSFPVFYPKDFDHSKKNIYMFHPHGLLSLSHYLNIGTNLTNWKDRETNGTTLSILWWIPFGNELLESTNFVPSNYDDMKNVLLHNKSLSVTLGGVKEMALSQDNKMILNIAKKKGIFKMALETGTQIVPILVYGENEIYKVSPNWLLKIINNYALKFNLFFPIPTFDSCYKWLRMFFEPLKIPVKTYVGSPIQVQKINEPTDIDILKLRKIYFMELRKLYKETRPKTYAKELFIV